MSVDSFLFLAVNLPEQQNCFSRCWYREHRQKSVYSDWDLFLLHVSKHFKCFEKTTGERVGNFSYPVRTFPSHLCNFLQSSETSIFFQTNIKAKVLKQPVTETKY